LVKHAFLEIQRIHLYFNTCFAVMSRKLCKWQKT